uniref:Putative transmembrane protein n=1 Tax=Toxoplasma gondii TgCATBr9 TaxID=943120 RepID=A0A2T6IEE5_TOXGO|nr:putative transmembrane protein [Toxoplasma gondii TgCATBr9]
MCMHRKRTLFHAGPCVIVSVDLLRFRGCASSRVNDDREPLGERSLHRRPQLDSTVHASLRGCGRREYRSTRFPRVFGRSKKNTSVELVCNCCCFLTAIPFSLVMLTTVGTGTIVIDRQFELRSLRRQSVSHREHEQEEQRKQFLKFLSQTSPTDQLDNSVPVPRDSQI